MTYLNILEKFKILYSSLLDFKVIIIFLGLIMFLTILYVTKKLNSKRYAGCIILSLIITLLISISNNKKILFKTFDNFLTIFFKNIYFPSVYVYIGIIVIILLATIVTFLNKKTLKAYKIINFSVFIINSMLFILILNIIAKNKIDVFSVSSLYTNESLVVALEISTSLFLLWLSLLLITYITEHIIEKISTREVKVKVKQKVKTTLETTIPQELNIVSAIESGIQVPLTANEQNIEVPLTSFNTNVTKVNPNNISFQDIFESITKAERIYPNIDSSMFTDQQYNLIFKEI